MMNLYLVLFAQYQLTYRIHILFSMCTPGMPLVLLVDAIFEN